MPSLVVNELNPRIKLIRLFLLLLFFPICFLMLFCVIYSTYLSVETWDCRQMDINVYINTHLNDTSNSPTDIKCYTILDSLNRQLSKYISERKLLLIVRTLSLLNTFSTYISAWIATYRLSYLPLVWLAMVSIASFFITINFSILFGPQTGINNFEVVPLFIGLQLKPLLVTSIVCAIDMLIAIIAICLVVNSYKKRISR